MNAREREDIVIRFLIDPDDLSDDQRRFLQNSPECMAEEAALRKDLARIGAVARDLAPEPRGRFLAEASEKVNGFIPRFFIRRFAPVLACLAAVFILITVFLQVDTQPPPDIPDVSALLLEIEEDHLLLNEIDRMVRYAQSGGYHDGEETSAPLDMFLDDEFIRFLVPLEEEVSSETVYPRRIFNV